MSDTELLQAFTEGRSEEAFAELVRRHAGLVYSTAKRRVANASIAEDITQLVFIRFAKLAPKLRTHAELAAWLHRTTVNITIDHWRTETRRRARELQAATMEPATTETTVWEEISPKLDEALNQLNEEERHALLLRYFSRKTMREVGMALGVSEDAAKMRVGRAVDRLRTHMGVSIATCTAAMLDSLLGEHSVEAAPSQLIAGLSAMTLPSAAGLAGKGLVSLVSRVSTLKVVSAAVMLVLLAFITIHFVNSLSQRATVAGAGSKTAEETEQIGNTGLKQPRSTAKANGFNPVPTERPAKVKLLFQVFDAQNGLPLARTKIHAVYFGAGGWMEGHDFFTDDKGAVALPEPDDPTKQRGMNVFAVAEGHVPKAVVFGDKPVPSDYTMKLDPAMTATGVVLDSQGQAVGGVKILVQRGGNSSGKMENVSFQTAPVFSRDDGSWSCSYLPFDYTNEIRFILQKDGYAVTFPVVPAAKVDLNKLALVIDRGFTVTGRVTDAQTQPVAGASVNAVSGNRDKEKSVKTDAQGVFTLTGVPGEIAAGTTAFYTTPALQTNRSGGFVIRGLVGHGPLHVDLSIQAKGFAPQTRTVELSATTNVVDFALSSGKIFRGRVVDESGNPIQNAVVETDWNDQNVRVFDWDTRTDTNGRFHWDSAPSEPVVFRFEADGYQPERDVKLVADGDDYKITLKR